MKKDSTSIVSQTYTSPKMRISKPLWEQKIYNLPLELQSIWSQVPTDKDLIFNDYLEDIKKFLMDNLNSGDFVLVQGDFGATYHMVNFCKLNGLIPLYSVNKRIAKEFIENGIVKKYSEFKHEFFREYH